MDKKKLIEWKIKCDCGFIVTKDTAFLLLLQRPLPICPKCGQPSKVYMITD